MKTIKDIRWELLTCQEASIFSTKYYMPCGKPAESIIWHNGEGKAYPMCFMCADHNLQNRGAILLARKEGI